MTHKTTEDLMREVDESDDGTWTCTGCGDDVTRATVTWQDGCPFCDGCAGEGDDEE